MVAAQQAAAAEATTAREIYQEALDAGWTASELATAGLKPPSRPRTRSTSTEPAEQAVTSAEAAAANSP